MPTTKWLAISDALKKVYEEENILKNFKEDETYLKHAFEMTEKLWEDEFSKIDKLKVIMIAEAPLFGDKETYIYNQNTPASTFFHFKDLEAFLDEGKSIQKPKTVQEQKTTMFEYFHKNGFIVLNLFAFALNENHTKINYQKMSKKLYYKLLKITTENYLVPKLKLCLEKSDENTHFIYRYKRLFDKTENHFEQVLNQVSSKGTCFKIDTINGTNMSLDRSKLRRLLRD